MKYLKSLLQKKMTFKELILNIYNNNEVFRKKS
jgi:hypothetical protein